MIVYSWSQLSNHPTSAGWMDDLNYVSGSLKETLKRIF